MEHTTVASSVAPRPLAPDAREPWPTFLRTMFWVGVNTFGGPVAQIGVMHREAVEKRRWVTDGEFVHLLNFANVLPGPEALELAIHLGYLRRGALGGIAAGLLFIWPGFVTLTLLGWMYVEYGNLAPVAAVLDGVRPVAVALIASAVVRLSTKALAGRAAYALMAAAFVASFVLRVPFLLLLLGGGVAGVALARTTAAAARGGSQRFALALVVLAFGAGFALRSSAPAAEALTAPAAEFARETGPERQAEIAWVNTKAALATFGGAYTVLPFMREQFVREKGWVGDAQIADALAMAETTPGPLISFGIFLSYLAGGLTGAVVGTVFLFLPSFVLVLGLGRHIEKVERIPRASQFLWGVSAATIGLILAMAAQVVPLSIEGAIDAALAVVAFLALWRLKANLLLVVGAGAAFGLLRVLAS
jgi:chromate transporter